MPRRTIKPAVLTPEEILGQLYLESWLESKTGRGAYLSRRTGMDVASISRMKNGFTRITLEAAILIELGTDRALKAEILCPSMAEVIKRFRNTEDDTAGNAKD